MNRNTMAIQETLLALNESLNRTQELRLKLQSELCNLNEVLGTYLPPKQSKPKASAAASLATPTPPVNQSIDQTAIKEKLAAVLTNDFHPVRKLTIMANCQAEISRKDAKKLLDELVSEERANYKAHGPQPHYSRK